MRVTSRSEVREKERKKEERERERECVCVCVCVCVEGRLTMIKRSCGSSSDTRCKPTRDLHKDSASSEHDYRSSKLHAFRRKEREAKAEK